MEFTVASYKYCRESPCEARASESNRASQIKKKKLNSSHIQPPTHQFFPEEPPNIFLFQVALAQARII
jgi:hypothetical protein